MWKGRLCSSGLLAAPTWGALLHFYPPLGAAVLAGIGVAGDSGVTPGGLQPLSPWEEGRGDTGSCQYFLHSSQPLPPPTPSSRNDPPPHVPQIWWLEDEVA